MDSSTSMLLHNHTKSCFAARAHHATPSDVAACLELSRFHVFHGFMDST